MRITFLGTGTSTGIPQVGCNCPVCTSSDRRNHRLRTSVLIEEGEHRLLLDCGPDFRQQMLTQPYAKLDGVLISHEHYDHVGGIDDLRPFGVWGSIPLYMEDYVAERIRTRLPYCFIEHKYPGVPNLEIHTVHLHESFQVAGFQILPVRVMHAALPIFGYLINGRVAYITDMKTIPDSELEYLQGVELLIVNGLRHKEHCSHQTIAEACEFAHKLHAQNTYLIHLSHQAGLYTDLEKTLPEDIHVSYDGLTVEL